MAKVKGTVILPLIKMLRMQREGAQANLPPSMHHYLDARVLPSTWYPAADHVRLLKAMAPMLGLPPGRDPMVFMGRGAAQIDLTGIYRAQLKVGDVWKTLHNFIALWRNYCDTGISAMDIDGERAARINIRNFEGVSREMCGIIGGYIEGLVATAGGKGEKMKKLKCRLDGDPYCEWSITWTSP
jgi:hypothetical protein